jgi:hypothetical protein
LLHRALGASSVALVPCQRCYNLLGVAHVKNERKFTVLIERDEEGYYVATVPARRGCHTQAKTLDTLMKRCAKLSSFALMLKIQTRG